MAIRNEDEIVSNEWSKPSIHYLKTREAFQKQYRISSSSAIDNDISIPVIYVEHNMDQSIISSYSKAMVMNTGIKMHK